MRSSTPVTVTVWGRFQLAAVKVRAAGETEPSVVRFEARAMETLAVGWELSTTVKVAVPPASVVRSPEVGVTVKPALSSLVMVPITASVVPTM